MEQISPLGTHCILELYGCSPDLLNDVLFVRQSVEEASRHGVSTLLKLSSHQFLPQGVTAVALLAESHISVHTWPECGYAAIDIFTCGEDAQPRQACDFLVQRFAARDHSLMVLPRGAGAPSGMCFPREPQEEEPLCRVRA